MDMKEIEEMFASMLSPLMARLEKVEELAAEARDDDRKLEGETEAAEVVVEVPEEVVDAVEEIVEAADKEDETEMGEYSRMGLKIAELEKASVLAEATVAQLREQIAMRDAQDAVSADIANKPHLSQMSEKLVSIYRKDRDLYNEVVSVAGEAKQDTKSILSQRVTSGFAEVQKPKDPFAAAHDVAAAQGITYRQALESLIVK